MIGPDFGGKALVDTRSIRGGEAVHEYFSSNGANFLNGAGDPDAVAFAGNTRPGLVKDNKIELGGDMPSESIAGFADHRQIAVHGKEESGGFLG